MLRGLGGSSRAGLLNTCMFVPLFTGSISITIKDAPSDGFFTEGCFALIEGDYTEEETLGVIAMGHPPCERRAVSRYVTSPSFKGM